ncbi:lysozyme inhibitor LprI family protein [Metapseudomonas furukawaii]
MQLLEINKIFLLITFLFVASTCFSNDACNDQGDIEKCVREYHEKSDLSLSNQYKKTMSILSQEHRNKLKSAEGLWISYRNDTCASLNYLDSISCESSLADQRTKELVLIERKTDLGVEYGVIEFIIAEYGERNEGAILAKALKRQAQTRAWGLYAEDHCRMMNELIGESFERCKIRLIFSNWDGF